MTPSLWMFGEVEEGWGMKGGHGQPVEVDFRHPTWTMGLR